MSKLVSRILLAVFMLPLGVVIYILSIIAFEQLVTYGPYSYGYASRETEMFAAAGVVTWGFVAGYWLLLWWKAVNWTPRRMGLTLAAAAGLLVAAVLVSAAGFASSRSSGDVTLAFCTILAPLWWLIFTVFIWRETSEERAKRIDRAGGKAVACPNCGYNLTGLGESRCPECGSRFTLDELLAAQPAFMVAEID
jgi:DNA-directed RNA polymerase subunit RPC12/RpoP